MDRNVLYFWIGAFSAYFLKKKCFLDPVANGNIAAGHDVNFCSDLPHRASEIQFSLALEKLYIIILYYFI